MRYAKIPLPTWHRKSLHIFRILLPLDRLPHFQIDVPASNPGCGNGVGRLGLADLSLTSAVHYLSPYIMLCGIGEGALGLWLLVAGVNAEAWKEQAGAAGELR